VKVLLAFIGATLVVFLALSPRPDNLAQSQSLPPHKAAESPQAPAVAETVQTKLELKPEDPQVQPSAPEAIKLERPEVRANGIIRNGETYILLSDVTPFTSKDVCKKSSGQRWACGLQAYATLHNMIAGHAIECIPRQVDGTNTVASCRLGSTNLAAELLKKGLVKLQPDSSDPELQQAQSYAKSGHIGIWQ
jgi:endonuclease YncB( thermonuclease family)